MVAECLSGTLGSERRRLLPVFQNILTTTSSLVPDEEHRLLAQSADAWEVVLVSCQVQRSSAALLAMYLLSCQAELVSAGLRMQCLPALFTSGTINLLMSAIHSFQGTLFSGFGVQKHFRAIVGAAQEYSGPLDDSVAYDIDTLTDHLRTFSSTVTKLAHLQNVLGPRFDQLCHDLSSFAFQRRRNYSMGFR